MNECDYVISSQNNDPTDDIVPPKLRVLHLESPLSWQGTFCMCVFLIKSKHLKKSTYIYLEFRHL